MSGQPEAQQNNLRRTRTDSQLRNVSGELNAAGRKAKKAIALEAENEGKEADKMWQTLFGSEAYKTA